MPDKAPKEKKDSVPRIDESFVEIKESITDVVLGPVKSRPKFVMAVIIALLGTMFVLFHVYTAAFPKLDPLIQRHLMLATVLVLGILVHPLGRRSWSSRLNWWFLVDLALIVMSLAPFLLMLQNTQKWRAEVAVLSPFEMILGTMTVIATLEVTRRVVGWALSILAIFFLFQNWYAPHMPGPFYGPSLGWNAQVQTIWSGTIGIFGMISQIVTNFLVMFFFFAALLKASGAGTTMMDLASALTGRYAGGPAKISVVASSFFGTMSGSPAANVVGTGSFTIPMMKKMGFKPAMAGAVEATASTGGQLMPPIMGITAFIIPQFLGVSYFRVITAAIIPCLLYYLAVFLQVHFEAKKMGISGLPASQLPRLKTALKPAWVVLVPVTVVMILLWYGYSMGKIGLYATLVMVACGMISRTQPRLTPRTIFDAIIETVQTVIPAAAICGTLGIIIACFYASGLGDRLGYLVVALGGGSKWLPIFLTGIICIILGMGVPTPIIYITMVLTVVPALLSLGIQPISAHMFVFFVGVSSGLTPPVCPTAFVGAAMAGAPMMRTGLIAFRLAIVGFIIPFVFIDTPALLMVGSPVEIAFWTAVCAAGTFALAIGFEGYWTNPLGWIERLIFFAAAIACFTPQSFPYSVIVSIIGTLVTATMMFVLVRGSKRRNSLHGSPATP